MNKWIGYGNVGKDPDTKTINGNTVTKFSLATNKTYTNKAGEKITETQWHNITMWGKVAEIASKWVKKGSSLIIEGEISYRTYENKEGQTVYITEIIASNMHMVGGKPESKPEPKSDDWKGKKPVDSMSDINELPQHVKDAESIPDDDLPY